VTSTTFDGNGDREVFVALRDKMSASAAQYLRPGEQVQAVFGAQTTGPMMLVLVGSLIRLIINKYRMFVVTDQRILVLDTGKWSLTKARGIVAELPRAARLGPAAGLWYPIETGQEKLYVHRRFFKDIAAADAAGSPVTG
jgi:hypothetical protein